MLGVIFTLVAVVTFGLNAAVLRRGVITGTVTQAVIVTIPMGLVAFTILAAASGQLGEIGRFSPFEFAMLVSVGLVHFVFGRYCAYRTIQAMGANLSAPIQQWSLLFALALAVGLLDESLDLMKLMGIALLMLGPAIVVRSENARTRTLGRAGQTQKGSGDAAKFEPKLAEGYIFGTLTCLAFGLSPILARSGLAGTGLALAGGVVSYGAAMLALALILLLPAARRDAAHIDRRNFRWFIWGGVAVSISQIFVYLALAITPVSVVQSLLRLDAVFSTLFGWKFNRSHEIFNWAVLTAIGISLVGALLLTLDAGAVMRWLNAPPWLADAFAWSWPDR